MARIFVKSLVVIMIVTLCYVRIDEASLTPVHLQPEIRNGRASWYSKQSPGINIHTANMEVFDDSDLTCAMWDVPFNQRIRVTNLANGKSIVVRVNDRGPHRRLGRIIDLSKGAFARLEDLDKGLMDVSLEFL